MTETHHKDRCGGQEQDQLYHRPGCSAL